MIAFLSSAVGRYLMAAAGAAILLFSAYSIGHSAGYDVGHKAGYDSRAPEVAHLNDNVIALSKLIDTERKQQFEKLQTVQADAAEAAIKTETRLQTQIRARDQVIANYSKAVPIEVQQQCGLSIETVRAINQLIDKVNGEQDEPKPDKAGPIPTADVSSPTADGMRPRSTAEEAAGRRSPGTEGRDREHSSEDAGTLQETPANGRPSPHAEGDAGVPQQLVDASSGMP